jgi:hypothetical protein
LHAEHARTRVAGPAPKGIHNRIPGNAATQFFGLLNSPAQIVAAHDMARAKGSSIPDVGRLGKGEFYVALEGGEFQEIQAPLCDARRDGAQPRAPRTTGRSPIVTSDKIVST